MAPSLLLQQENPFSIGSRSSPVRAPSKRVDVDGGVSLEAHAPVGGAFSVHSSSPYGNGHVNGSNGVPAGSGYPGRQLNGDQFITAEHLLEQSRNFAAGGSGADGPTKKPNILYIMADQMAAPLLKMNNPNSVIKTPNLDELAKDGVVFSSAYCNSPLCAPSRFTMCTGQLPSKIGGYDNASVFSSEVPTYAHYLRNEGYETVLAGKMHFIGPDQLHGFEYRQVLLSSDPSSR